MKRKIIRIDEDKCTGCGDCIPNCPEGALQIIDAKARLVSDLFCDGLGACLGHCPEEAIIVEEREAEPYDEKSVMINIIRQGPNVIAAHLAHLREHGEKNLLAQALAVLEVEGIRSPALVSLGPAPVGCPGSRSVTFQPAPVEQPTGPECRPRSQLTHWPVQLHLISPRAPHYRGSRLLVSADCAAYAAADFHQQHLKDHSLAIACPKLDQGQDVYQEKLRALIDEAEVESISVLIMQVPCCMGLLRLVRQAAEQAHRTVPVKCTVLSVQGDVLREM